MIWYEYNPRYDREFKNGIIDEDEPSISFVCEKVIIAYNKLGTDNKLREMNFEWFFNYYLERAIYWLKEIQM